MEIFTLPLAANDVREVGLAGNYFELRSALYGVDIELLDRTGAVVNLMKGALESDFVQSALYQTVRITNGATAQTVKFWYGVGQAGSRRFSGSVTGTVALDAPTLAALIAGKYNVRAELPSGNWNSSAALAANTASAPLFSAAANVNGAIILQASYADTVGSAAEKFAFVAKATAPANVNDGEVVFCGGPAAFNGVSAYIYNDQLMVPRRIAAGLGLYNINSVATTASGIRAAAWILL